MDNKKTINYDEFHSKYKNWKVPSPTSVQQKLTRLYKFTKEIINHILFYFTIIPFVLSIARVYYLKKSDPKKIELIQNQSSGNNSTAQTNNEIEHHFIKDISYGEKIHQKLDLHLVHASSSQNEKYKVVVFLYGGAWGSGDKQFYSLMGETLAEYKIITVVPNYATYPKGKVEDMIEDISDTLSWTLNNIGKYNGDPQSIHLVGHSAGAHLGALYLIRKALYVIHGENSLGPYKAKQSKLDTTIPVKSFIGISGVYDIIDHYHWEYNRAVEQISPMKPAMNGCENFHHHSPSILVKEFASTSSSDQQQASASQLSQMTQESISDMEHMNQSDHQHLHTDLPKLLPSFHFIHGTDDKTVPYSSSNKLFEELKKCGMEDVHLHLYDNVGHSALILAMMMKQNMTVLKHVVDIVKSQ